MLVLKYYDLIFIFVCVFSHYFYICTCIHITLLIENIQLKCHCSLLFNLKANFERKLKNKSLLIFMISLKELQSNFFYNEFSNRFISKREKSENGLYDSYFHENKLSYPSF